MRCAVLLLAFAPPSFFAAAAADLGGDCPDPTAAESEPHEVLLLQVESNVHRGLRSKSPSTAVEAAAHQPHDARLDHGPPPAAGWFGSFSEGESTWSQDGVSAHLDLNSERLAQEGFDSGMATWSQAQAWFHESPSGASGDAWQTHYPAVDGSVAGNRHVRDNPWRNTPAGWVQDYLPVSGRGPAGPAQASWFDSHVEQYDGFGRQMLPTQDSPLRHLGWEERSVNTTLQCAEPGCTATSHLQAFDGLTERGTNCMLSVAVHPTDFDEDHSNERVDLLSANGQVLSQDCNPRARGCNETAESPLYHCLNSFPVDNIVDELGSLVLVGRITELVDECPFDGNLLAGIAMVTCLVSPIPETTTTPEPPLPGLMGSNGSAPLRCMEPGCIAHADIFFNPFNAQRGGTCLLRVDVNQTDFDGEHGQTEVIEYLQVEGVNISEAISPGLTPCVAAHQGNPVAEADLVYTIVEEYDVTEAVLGAAMQGRLRITGKISADVDECGTPFLLDGFAQIACSPPPPEAEDEGSEAAAAALLARPRA